MTKHQQLLKSIPTMLAVCALTAQSFADVITTYDNRDEWESAVGHQFTTLDFTDGEHLALIESDTYTSFGVTLKGTAQYLHEAGLFLNDDWGFRGIGDVWIAFDSPQHWIAADFAGLIWIDLYLQGELIEGVGHGVGGLGNFGGIISLKPFDMVRMYKPEPFLNNIHVDDLHFGALVPGPGALGLLGIACIFPRRRRRG